MVALVTGGSGSGKSAYAERQLLALNAEENIYLATMICRDAESRRRVERHRRMREGGHFRTVERPLDLKHLDLPGESQGRAVLLECMSNLTANEMFEPGGAGPDGAEEEILEGLAHLKAQCEHLVVVTNELFSDGVRYDESTTKYLQILGRINRRIAAEADRVTEVVCGIPVVWKAPGMQSGTFRSIPFGTL